MTWRQTAVWAAWVSVWSLPAQIWVASIAPAVTVLATWAALEEPRGAASTQSCQGLCCLCSYCLPLEICLIGDPVGDFWPRSWQSFCFTKDHAIGPCRHPSVHTMCCLWVRLEIFQCWKAKIPEWLPFFPPCFDFVVQELVFFPPPKTVNISFNSVKKQGAFSPSLFSLKQFRDFFFPSSQQRNLAIFPYK